jgi:hypothetical protein
VVIGSLKTIVESTLGTDLADKPAVDPKRFAGGPGKASWSWPLLGDDNTVVPVQKRFIDYAARMKWQYTLVDSAWDRQIGYDGLAELVEYGRAKGVKILIWYNSAGTWNTTPLTPRDRMLTRDSRRAEFAKGWAETIEFICGHQGGLFRRRRASTMTYYQDILADAAEAGLLVNFHGAAAARLGAHLAESHDRRAVRGMEFVTFEQKHAEDEPWHAAMLRLRGMSSIPWTSRRGARSHSQHRAAYLERLRTRAVGAVHLGDPALRGDPGGHGQGASLRAGISARRAGELGRRQVHRRIPGPVRGSRAARRQAMVDRRHQCGSPAAKVRLDLREFGATKPGGSSPTVVTLGFKSDYFRWKKRDLGRDRDSRPRRLRAGGGATRPSRMVRDSTP